MFNDFAEYRVINIREKQNKMIKNEKITECVATDHAYARAKERLSWSKKTLDRMMPKVLNEGYRHAQTKGKLKKYITQLYKKENPANNIRIYGENIYFFNSNVLITVYQLENDLKRYLAFCC
ncbi:MAG: hypothetical protein AAGG68_23770 [Bacteroidota bacterium]